MGLILMVQQDVWGFLPGVELNSSNILGFERGFAHHTASLASQGLVLVDSSHMESHMAFLELDLLFDLDNVAVHRLEQVHQA